MSDLNEMRIKSSGQYGRTWRKRRRKHRIRQLGVYSYAVDDNPVLVKLNQWMCNKGSNKLSYSKLKSVFFADTGRGLMTVDGVHVGDVVVSIPKQALVTCNNVLQDAELQKSFQISQNKFRAMEILTFFLLYHRYLGDNSEWKPYLDSLPKDYTVPAHCSVEETNVFPEFLKSLISKQLEDVEQCYNNMQKIVSQNPKLNQMSSRLCVEDVKWGWFTVNTRAVYLKEDNPASCITDEDVYALAPFLDLLNHSYTAQVTTGINEKNGCYEIVSKVAYGPYEQVFINYGPHDNVKLYVEYGFTLQDNPHNYVPVDLDDVLAAVMNITNDPLRKALLHEKTKVICAHRIDKNLGVSIDGPSWNVEVATTICLMTPEEISWWQVVYEDLVGVCHRNLVMECIALVIHRKVHQLQMCMFEMKSIQECSNAFAVGRNLVRECCSLLENVKVMKNIQ